ncbi:hypothetical protein [Longilinea arvoryzae]|uniref:hypothetical protein n=1 Tax=Longilinea arvoryzae TaxID=360412 RepID=UPI0015612B5D|nr:hypothetical protein [Longilinea arvoryzae]
MDKLLIRNKILSAERFRIHTARVVNNGMDDELDFAKNTGHAQRAGMAGRETAPRELHL